MAESDFLNAFPHKIKVQLYQSVTSFFIEYGFEPSEFLQYLVNLFLIAYPNQEELRQYNLEGTEVLSYNNYIGRPAAVKAYLVSLKLKENQLHFLLKAFHHALIEAEKEIQEFAYTKVFIESELEKLTAATHREKAIAHKYKVKVEIAEQLTREQMRESGGKNFELAFDSLNPKSKQFKGSATQAELKNVIELLISFPKAQEAAINDLQKLKQ